MVVEATVTTTRTLHQHPAVKEAKEAKAVRAAKAAKETLDPHHFRAGTAHALWVSHLTISSVLNVSRSTHPSKSAPDATRHTSSAAPATTAAVRSMDVAYSIHPLIEPSRAQSSRLRSQVTSAPTWRQTGAPLPKSTNSLLRPPSCPTPSPKI